MSRALLILWIATLGADRVDLLGGAGPLLLRPVLLLIPPMIVLELLRLSRRGRSIRLPVSAAIFFAGLTLLIAVLILSTMYSQEVGLGFRRLALLIVEAYAAFLAVIFLINRPDPERIVLRGAQLGLVLIAVFDVVQVSRWFGGPSFDWLSLGGIIDLAPPAYGPWVPRPSGVSLDPNRGGLLIILYVYLVSIFSERKGARRWALLGGAVLLLVTLSRSAILSAAALAGFLVIRRGLRLSRGGVAAVSIALAAMVAALLVSPAVERGMLAAVELVAGRLSLEEGSSNQHLQLLVRGWEIATESARNALVGIGFGNSYLVLQDIFPGTKYANFHSAYVSLLVEAGIGGLLGFVLLAIRPLATPSPLRPLVVGLVVFNVFYQSHVDSAFWFALALAWVHPDLQRPVPAPAAGSGSRSGESGTPAAPYPAGAGLPA